mgnify:CR=1 FL=1
MQFPGCEAKAKNLYFYSCIFLVMIPSRYLFIATLSTLWMFPLALLSQKAELRPDTSLLHTFLNKASHSKGDTASENYRAAVEVAELCLKAGGSPSYILTVKQQRIRAWLGLGLVYYGRMEYGEAMKWFRKSLSEAEKIKDLSLWAESYFNIAEVYLEQSHFQEAMEYYGLSLSKYGQLNDVSGQFWCYTGMGIVQKQSGNYTDAVFFYRKALTAIKEKGLKYEEAICFNNLGNIYRKTGDFPKAMESYQQAIEVFKNLKDDAAVSDCLNNIGNLFSDHSNPFRALEYYSQSMKIAKEIKDDYRLLIRYKNMANVYIELKDYENAALFLEDALKLATRSGDKAFLASCNMLYGRLHAEKKDYIIASAYFRKSAGLYAEAGTRPEQGEALVELAHALLKQNQVQEGLRHAHEALALAEKTGSLKGRLEANQCLAACYDRAEDYYRAYQFLLHAASLKDSIYTADKYRTIEEIDAGFKQNELKKQNEALSEVSRMQKQAIQTKNIIVLLLALSLLMGVTLIYLIYKRVKKVRKETGRIRQMSEEKIVQLSEDLIGKERELTSKTLFINQKNQLLERIIKELEELKTQEVSSQSVHRLQMQLKQELSPNAWKEFEIQFNEVHPGFQTRLMEGFPALTPAERRLCAFIRLGMNTREISSLTGQTTKSIEVARTRIRKKLEVPHGQNLANAVAQL